MAGVKFTNESASRISRAVQKIERQRSSLVGNRNGLVPQDGWYPFKNVGSQTVPAFGVMRVTSSTESVTGDKHSVILKCQRPDTTFSRIYAVNGPEDIAVDGFGLCRLPPFDNVEVLYDTADSPAFGEGWGPQPSSFKLKKNYPQTAIIIGELSDLEGAKTVLCSWGAIIDFQGKADGTIANAASGTISLWYGDFAGDTTVNLTIVNDGPDVASGDKMTGAFPNGIAKAVKLCDGT
jgi:hypothetical protein